MVTGYAILSLVMEHNVCRFNRADYEDDPDAKFPIHDDPEKYPDVTPTLQLCFIIGLTLHSLLFILGVYFEPHFRYYKAEP